MCQFSSLYSLASFVFEFPYVWHFVFPLLLLKFSLSLTLAILIVICLSLGVFGDLVWESLCFLDLDVYFLSHIRKVFGYYVFRCVLFFLFYSGTPMMWVLVNLTWSWRSLKLLIENVFAFPLEWFPLICRIVLICSSISSVP